MVGVEEVNQLEGSLEPDADRMAAVGGALDNAAQARPDYALVDGTSLPRVLTTTSSHALVQLLL